MDIAYSDIDWPQFLIARKVRKVSLVRRQEYRNNRRANRKGTLELVNKQKDRLVLVSVVPVVPTTRSPYSTPNKCVLDLD